MTRIAGNAPRLEPLARPNEMRPSSGPKGANESSDHYQTTSSSTQTGLRKLDAFRTPTTEGISTRPLLASRRRQASGPRVDPWLLARYRNAEMRSDHFAELLGRPRGPRIESARPRGRGPGRREVERAEAEANALEAEFLRNHGTPGSEFFTVPETSRPSAMPLPPLSAPLKRKMRRIRNETAAGGNRGVDGVMTRDEAHRLGIEFVGPGARLTRRGDALISADGLRQYRFQQKGKSGRNPVTGERWSSTGAQVNFESRSVPKGDWINNVHLDVQ
ncbi:MAG: hypothetical protein AAFZ38_00365 [Myxococcota bacterium]